MIVTLVDARPGFGAQLRYVVLSDLQVENSTNNTVINIGLLWLPP